MISGMKCTQCGSDRIVACEFDGFCFQCKKCASMWNAEYVFYLARENHEEKNTKTKTGRDPDTA